MPTRINKFLVSIAGTLGVVTAALSDGTVSATELTTIIASVLGTILVYAVPNHGTTVATPPPPAPPASPTV